MCRVRGYARGYGRAFNDCIYSRGSLNREPVVYVRAWIGLDQRGRDGRTAIGAQTGFRDTSALIEVNGRGAPRARSQQYSST